MNATELLAALHKEGHAVLRSGDTLIIRPRPSSEMMQHVKEHREEILDRLSDPWATSLFKDVLNDDAYWAVLRARDPNEPLPSPPPAATDQLAARDLVWVVRKAGVQLWVEDGKLRYQGDLTDEHRAELTRLKPHVIRWLSDEIPF